jgi:RimJ/RimL family protein N-acetyltransferase
MIRPTLIPFKAEHLLAFQDRDLWARDRWRLAFEKERGGPAFTVMVGDTIIACAGIVLPWPGLGLVWMALSDDIGSHRVWLTRRVRRMMHDAIRSLCLHRLEATVLADNARNQRWIEALGFSRENGKARAYTTDRKDMLRYELVLP